jgi:hypothetical protein
VLGRVVVDGQQFFHVVGDLGGGPGPLGSVQLFEGADGVAGVVLVLGVPISARAFFALGCADFGHAESTFAVMWNQHLWAGPLGGFASSLASSLPDLNRATYEDPCPPRRWSPDAGDPASPFNGFLEAAELSPDGLLTWAHVGRLP